MATDTWRKRFRPFIAAILAEVPKGTPLGDVRKLLREKFPAGPRQYHPYKIWCDEWRLQLGLKKTKAEKAAEVPSGEGLFK